MKRRKINPYKISAAIFLFLFCGTLTFLLIKDGLETSAVSTTNFSAGNIISDYTMSNYNSMTEAEIQSFLNSKNSCNKTFSSSGYTDEGNGFYSNTFGTSKKYIYHIKDGKFVCLPDEIFGEGNEFGETVQNGETAAHIIWQAAQDYKINPQVLIVLLEKEQGLITDQWPNNYQYRAATGYGCPDTAPCDEQYYGLKNQIRKAAELYRTVLDGGWTNYPLGNNYIRYNPNASCGGSIVNIENLATSALYRYTPYQPNQAALDAGYGTATCGAYGNRNFYLYFYDWFGDPQLTSSDENNLEPLGAIISSNKIADETTDIPMNYETSVQKYGWTGSVSGGQMSGTAGYSLHLDAIKISLQNQTGIEYKTHISNIGWENTYKKDGEISGQSGSGLQIEAIKIRLTGTMAAQYDILYRTHIQNIGWTEWASNDEVSGTTGQSLRMEAIQIKIIKKQDVAIKDISYRVHVQDIGWMDWVQNGTLAGTTGQSKRLEAIEIKISSR